MGFVFAWVHLICFHLIVDVVGEMQVRVRKKFRLGN